MFPELRHATPEVVEILTYPGRSPSNKVVKLHDYLVFSGGD
jgi:hypothetical protein